MYLDKRDFVMTDSEKIVSLKSVRNKPKEEKKAEKKVEQAEQPKANEPVYCSFCGRPNTQVVKMVQGPGVNICSECTMIAIQYLILEDKLPSSEAQKILDIFWSKIK